jgi:hypothetical protein
MRKTVMATGVDVSTYHGVEGRNYDYPIPLTGLMAKQQLARVAHDAAALEAVLRESDRLPPWVQYKISTGEDRIRAATDYMLARIAAEPEGTPYGADAAPTSLWSAVGGRNFAKIAITSTLTAAAVLAAGYGVVYAYKHLKK